MTSDTSRDEADLIVLELQKQVNQSPPKAKAADVPWTF